MSVSLDSAGPFCDQPPAVQSYLQSLLQGVTAALMDSVRALTDGSGGGGRDSVPLWWTAMSEAGPRLTVEPQGAWGTDGAGREAYILCRVPLFREGHRASGATAASATLFSPIASSAVCAKLAASLAACVIVHGVPDGVLAFDAGGGQEVIVSVPTFGVSGQRPSRRVRTASGSLSSASLSPLPLESVYGGREGGAGHFRLIMCGHPLAPMPFASRPPGVRTALTRLLYDLNAALWAVLPTVPQLAHLAATQRAACIFTPLDTFKTRPRPSRYLPAHTRMCTLSPPGECEDVGALLVDALQESSRTAGLPCRLCFDARSDGVVLAALPLHYLPGYIHGDLGPEQQNALLEALVEAWDEAGDGASWISYSTDGDGSRSMGAITPNSYTLVSPASVGPAEPFISPRPPANTPPPHPGLPSGAVGGSGSARSKPIVTVPRPAQAQIALSPPPAAQAQNTSSVGGRQLAPRRLWSLRVDVEAPVLTTPPQTLTAALTGTPVWARQPLRAPSPTRVTSPSPRRPALPPPATPVVVDLSEDDAGPASIDALASSLLELLAPHIAAFLDAQARLLLHRFHVTSAHGAKAVSPSRSPKHACGGDPPASGVRGRPLSHLDPCHPANLLYVECFGGNPLEFQWPEQFASAEARQVALPGGTRAWLVGYDTQTSMFLVREYPGSDPGSLGLTALALGEGKQAVYRHWGSERDLAGLDAPRRKAMTELARYFESSKLVVCSDGDGSLRFPALARNRLPFECVNGNWGVGRGAPAWDYALATPAAVCGLWAPPALSPHLPHSVLAWDVAVCLGALAAVPSFTRALACDLPLPARVERLKECRRVCVEVGEGRAATLRPSDLPSLLPLLAWVSAPDSAATRARDILAATVVSGRVPFPLHALGEEEEEVLSGRHKDAARLKAALVDGRRDGLFVVSVCGEPGVGKTALARCVVRTLRGGMAAETHTLTPPAVKAGAGVVVDPRIHTLAKGQTDTRTKPLVAVSVTDTRTISSPRPTVTGTRTPTSAKTETHTPTPASGKLQPSDTHTPTSGKAQADTVTPKPAGSEAFPDGILWLDASSTDSAMADLRLYASQWLGVSVCGDPSVASPGDVTGTVRDWLTSRAGWLVVLDGLGSGGDAAPDTEVREMWALVGLDACTRGRVLITTPHPSLPLPPSVDTRVIALDGLGEADACAVLGLPAPEGEGKGPLVAIKRVVPKGNEERKSKEAAEVGEGKRQGASEDKNAISTLTGPLGLCGLPLPLSLLSSLLLLTPGLPLARVSARVAAARRGGEGPVGAAVATVLENLGEAHSSLLQWLCFLAPAPIPLPLLRWLCANAAPLRPLAGEGVCDEVLSALESVGLVRMQGADDAEPDAVTISVCVSVRAVVHARASPHTPTAGHKPALLCVLSGLTHGLRGVFQCVSASPRAHSLSLCVWGCVAKYALCDPVMATLGEAHERRARADCCHLAGLCLLAVCDTAGAASLLRSAISLCAYPATHTLTGGHWCALGDALLAAGQVDAAWEAHRTALGVLVETAEPPPSPQLVRRLEVLADAYGSAAGGAAYSTALRRLLIESLKCDVSCRRALASSLFSLSASYTAAGRMLEARACVRDACALPSGQWEGWENVFVAAPLAPAWADAVCMRLRDRGQCPYVRVCVDGDSPPLPRCCADGCVEGVKWCVTHGADPNYPCQGLTPYLLAASCGQLEVCQWFVARCGQVAAAPAPDGRGALQFACASGSVALAGWLVDSGASPSAPDKYGWTPLMAAVAMGHLTTARWLVDGCSVNPHEANQDGWSPLLLACLNGHLDIVRWLVSTHKCDAIAMTQAGRSPLLCACEGGHTNIAEWLVNHARADPCAANDSGWTPLLCACKSGHMGTAEWLVVACSDDPRAETQSGFSPLAVACAHGHTELVQWLADHHHAALSLEDVESGKLLLSACGNGHLGVARWLVSVCGFDPHGNEQKGRRSPLAVACKEGRTPEAVWLIDECGVSPNAPTKDGLSPLMLAVGNGHLATARALFARGAEPNATSKDGLTALMYACGNGQTRVAAWLVETCKADVNVTTQEGVTALVTSCRAGNADLATWLVTEHRAQTTVSPTGWVPLLWACQSGNLKLVQWLVSHCGADPLTQTQDGWTPLLCACASGHLDVCQWLKTVGADLTAGTGGGVGALLLACGNGYLSVAKWLVEACGVIPSAANKEGLTPLLAAIQQGRLPVLTWLVQSCGVPVAPHAKTGMTPLELACQSGHGDVARFLLTLSGEQGLDVGALFLRACERGHVSVARWLAQDYPDAANANAATPAGVSPLLLACGNGHVEVCRWLVTSLGADPNHTNKHGLSALVYACGTGQLEAAMWLVSECGADPHQRSLEGVTPLIAACRNGHIAVGHWLVSVCGANVNEATLNGRTSFLVACGNGHLEAARWLATQGANTKAVTKSGRNALMLACRKGALPMAQWLVSSCAASVVDGDEDGATPLMLASQQGHLAVVKWLVDACCASLDAKDKNGWTALQYACVGGHGSIVRWFVRTCGMDITTGDSDGVTPLMVACQTGYLEMAKWLVTRCGADPNAPDALGRTPLALACSSGRDDVVRWLVDACAVDKHMAEQDGRTPLTSACMNGHLPIAKWLVANCAARPDEADEDGWTPLMFASASGQAAVVRWLVQDCGISPTEEYEDGLTPLVLASAHGHSGVVEVLMSLGVHVSDPNLAKTGLTRADSRWHSRAVWLHGASSLPRRSPRATTPSPDPLSLLLTDSRLRLAAPGALSRRVTAFLPDCCYEEACPGVGGEVLEVVGPEELVINITGPRSPRRVIPKSTQSRGLAPCPSQSGPSSCVVS